MEPYALLAALGWTLFGGAALLVVASGKRRQISDDKLTRLSRDLDAARATLAYHQSLLSALSRTLYGDLAHVPTDDADHAGN